MKYNDTACGFLSRFSAALSIFGSAWIILSIIWNHKKRAMCYHRLLLGLSFFDLFSSICFFIGRWAQPSYFFIDDDMINMRSGNITTCNISGFFIFLGGLAIPWYNVSISIYYYLAICHGWREMGMKKSFERYVHVLICPIAILIAIVPFFMDMYNPYYFFCFATMGNARGSVAAHLTFQQFYMVSVLLCTGIIICIMIKITTHVRTITRNSSKYNISSFLVRIGKGTTEAAQRQRESRRSRRKRTKASEVRTMALLYTLPFIFTWFLPVLLMETLLILMVLPRDRDDVDLSMVVNFHNNYMCFFYPLQGFMNWLVYLRPQLKKMTERISGRVLSVAIEMCSYCFYFRNNMEKDDGDCYLGSGMDNSEEEEDADEIEENGTGEDPHPKDESVKEGGSIDNLSMASVKSHNDRQAEEYYSYDEIRDEVENLSSIAASLGKELELSTIV